MRKFKFFIDFEKEEKWLEEMAAQGYQFESKSFGYRFRSSEPEKVMIKTDYRIFKRREDFEDYCALFEDSGWLHIWGTKRSGTQYFKKVKGHSNEDNEDIFSDQFSRAGKYKRSSRMFAELSIYYFPVLIVLLMTGMIDGYALLDPQRLYLTKGLWLMDGEAFWRAFLFETPFALMRGFFLLFLPGTLLVYGYCAYRSRRLYDRQINAS